MAKYVFLAASFLLAVYFISPPALSAESTYLIRNMENNPILPRNFRMTTDLVSERDITTPSFLGLAELNASGSAQFSQQSLKKVMESIPNWNITVVDLRQEPHGILNGMAITWYSHNNWTNTGLSKEEIELDQQERMLKLISNPKAFVYTSKHKEDSFTVSVKVVESEEEISTRLGLGYKRIFATDHTRPSDEAVEDFVNFVKTLEDGTWLHFHCSAGQGRTTTFMAMYDMMKNASQVSAEDIINRQALIGGLDLLSIPDVDHWKYPYVVARAEFVVEFYRYCIENPEFSIGWLDWLAAQES